ncbi:hypothetical protein [Pseudomonas sp. NMI795_08]|uniref:hypothetical protein n=1 Tax=Pseudomonas sp. NMI795_08 TaxID=2903144 RepID=UPI001E495190|nr:hypothetical protein [Pseudomonas sp. NMI795_08]MCE1119137.1 hypothetical protein [Pseudomonas sp. NMI795_08]
MAATQDKEQKNTTAMAPPIGNPLVFDNPNDTVAALRDYLADMAITETFDESRPRGRYLRLMVALGAVDSLRLEKLHHR